MRDFWRDIGPVGRALLVSLLLVSAYMCSRQ